MRLGAVALVIGAAFAAGCAMQSPDDSLDDEPKAPLNGERENVAPPASTSEDAAPPTPAVYRGNPLCHIENDSACIPDDDSEHVTADARTCGPAPTKAGADAATSASLVACRMARDPVGGEIVPTCAPNALGAGVDGDSCEAGDGCAAGFDCVANDKGAKACRHYCCTGSCKGHTSNSGGATFCDVQGLVDVNQKAPVCVPLKRCTLLGSGECTDKETCAVVTESGDTGCIATGDQQVGASCDEDHCAAQLTCLGQPGSRKCFKLCSVASNDCDASQVCTTSTVFKDPTFGICQKP